MSSATRITRHFANTRTLNFFKCPSKVTQDPNFKPRNLVFVGTKEALQDDATLKYVNQSHVDLYKTLLQELAPGSTSSFTCKEEDRLLQFTVSVLPNITSRTLPPSRSHALTKQLLPLVNGAKADLGIIIALANKAHALPTACSVARTHPIFTKKTTKDEPKSIPHTRVAFVFLNNASHGSISDEDFVLIQNAVLRTRETALIVDTPPEEMNTLHFHNKVQEWFREARASNDCLSLEAVVGEDLAKRGFGGIYGVGKQGVHEPRLVVLSHIVPGAEKTVALVGKGIVYDTGGLSLKISGSMVGMKSDCGGAAAVFNAFAAAIDSQQYSHVNLHCVLCLAENAIGPEAMRNDDILHMFSGKTVEINNTDAEGRLVLADGVAYASKVLKADLVLDMATLTGAQLITTGKTHAGLMASSLNAEQAGVRSGLRSGDVVFPMLFAPELLRSEFDSKVADMKNSVADRSNAQASCAGTFIYDHLSDDFKGTYMHVDIAGPSTFDGGRGTGFGVAFVLDLLKHEVHNALSQDDSSSDN